MAEKVKVMKLQTIGSAKVKVMKLQTIGSATVFSLLATLSGGDFPFIPNVQAKISYPQVLAQTPTDRKAEADRLLKQGSQQFEIGRQLGFQSIRSGLQIGETQAMQQSYQQALQSWQQALIIYREIKDRQGERNALVNLKNAYDHLNFRDYARAIEQQLLALMREIKDRQGERNALVNLANAYRSLGDYTKAIEYEQQLLALTREIKDRQGEQVALIHLENAYLELGDHAKALQYKQQWLALSRELKDREREENAKDLESKQQWLALSRERKDRQGEKTALRELGFAYLRRNNYAKAIDYFQQWLAIARELKDRQGEETALINLGSACHWVGDHAKAIEYKLALSDLKGRKGEGGAVGDLGLAYLFAGDYAKAIEYEQQLLALARETKNRKIEGAALGNLGLAYLRLGDYTKAIEYEQQWLAISRELKDRQGEELALNILGAAYLELGDYAKSIEYEQQLLALARETKNRQFEGIALGNLGVELYRQGNFTAAEKTLLDSIQASESIQGISLNDARDIAEAINIFDSQTKVYLDLQRVLIAQKKTNEALEIAERGRARAFAQSLATRLTLSVSAQITINPPNIQQIQQIAAEQNATLVEYSTIGNEALYIWVIKPTGEITFRSVELKSLNINLRQATESTRVYAATGRGVNEQDTVFADIIRGTRDALGISENNLSHQPATNRPNSTPSNSQTAHPKLQQLYQLLIEPIADLLPTAPNDPVIFIPHQSLFLVPFASLQNAQGQYLIEKHTIVTAPAIKILQLTRQAKQKQQQISSQTILVVGNPTMPKIGNPPQQLPALPGSELEAKIIANLLNTQAMIGSQATKASITQQMSKARIIHLATHGLLNEVNNQFMPGAIALAPSGNDDGLLTSSEILD